MKPQNANAMYCKRMIPSSVALLLAGGAVFAALPEASSMEAASSKAGIQDRTDPTRPQVEKQPQVEGQMELGRVHEEFRRRVRAAFQVAATGGMEMPEGERGQRPGGVQDEKPGQEQPGLGQPGQGQPGQGQDRTGQMDPKELSFETSQLLITSLDSNLLLAGAPIRDDGSFPREAGGQRPDDEGNVGGGQENQPFDRNERPIGGILISDPSSMTTLGQAGGREGVRAEPVASTGQIQPGFYVVVAGGSMGQGRGMSVKLVDENGRARHTIDFKDDKDLGPGDRVGDGRADDVRGAGVPPAFADSDKSWERVYGRILAWCAPRLTGNR